MHFQFWSFVPRFGALIALIFLTACANFYVDVNTKEISNAEFKKPQPARPAQVLFEFQTKGVLNARATDHLKAKALDQIRSSGLFSSVSDAPAADGQLLTITVNNVPLSDDAFSKGFVTGLTFGLAGSQVSDGYVCTARYTSRSGQATVIKQARHAIHTTVGASSAPVNGVKAESIEQAVTLMLRQVISNVLRDVSNDANFN
jgi:hypothetical protein